LGVAFVLCTFGGQALPAPQMTFLDNGQVRIGMDLALGGAVTFISSKDHPGNIINSADLGRQMAILDCLAKLAYQNAKDEFTVPGIGKLVVVNRKARTARNPQTGAEIQVPAKKALKFRISKAAKDAVLGSTTSTLPINSSTATPSATI
jgi:DNA-binding protein HU-beta